MTLGSDQMKYTVDNTVFEINPDLRFGIIIGEGIKNSETTPVDEARLRSAEEKMRTSIKAEEIRDLRNVSLYRDIMTKAGINPNKYMASVEAMYKRIIKGSQLPLINAIVDLCNAVAIEEMISLGAHDLDDIKEDLEVRFSRQGDVFLPFGEVDYEDVEPGEIVFTSGSVVQTRKWLWRQSELGKTSLESNHLIFQLVGFGGNGDQSLDRALNSIEELIINRFGGRFRTFVLDKENKSIEF